MSEAAKLVEIRSYEDARGRLTVVEGGTDFDFNIKRVFWMTGCGDATRGGQHVNNCRYLVVAPAGTLRVVVGLVSMYGGCGAAIDPRFSATLDSPDVGLLVEPRYATKILRFSEGAVCLVLAEGKFEGGES